MFFILSKIIVLIASR